MINLQKCDLATNLFLRLQSRAQQSWDLPTPLQTSQQQNGSVTLSAMQHPIV